jgi:peptide/nickel transport system substrate-binding protein
MPSSILGRAVALLLLFGVAPLAAGCRETPGGPVKVSVIGPAPTLRDPAAGPLSAGDSVLIANVAQGLVRFDPAGNIVAGLAERWNVSDDGMSYIFRIAPAEWSGGGKISAQQVARILKRALGPRSRNALRDTLGAVDDIVAMTDRVVEIRLKAPRPNLLALLAQPELAILRGRTGAGPFTIAAEPAKNGALMLTREIVAGEDEKPQKQTVQLGGATADAAVREFAAGHADLVLGGTFSDLRAAQRANLPRGRLRFDPASGLFGLAPVRSGDALDDPEIRRLLSAAIDREALVAQFAVPGLTPRATVLEPGLDGLAAPLAPAWFAVPLAERRPGLIAQVSARFGAGDKPILRLWLPSGSGGDLLLALLTRDWGALGFQVERAASLGSADFRLIDEVAPSTSPAWFLRRFGCHAARLCDKEADSLLEAARNTPLPAQRIALLQQAADRIEQAQLFLPIAAPVRWSLVSPRLRGFAGNRFARHTLIDLEQRPGRRD